MTSSIKPPQAVTAAVEALRRAVAERQRLDARLEEMQAQRDQAAARKAAAASRLMQAELRGDQPPEEAIADMREVETVLAKLEGLGAAARQTKADMARAIKATSKELHAAVWIWAQPLRDEALARYRKAAAELVALGADVNAWAELLGLPSFDAKVMEPFERIAIASARSPDQALTNMASDLRMLGLTARHLLAEDRKSMEHAA